MNGKKEFGREKDEIVYDFNCPVPAEAVEYQHIKKFIDNSRMYKDTYRLIFQRFQEKPVWLTEELVRSVNMVHGGSTHAIKFLRTVAYRFNNGPWNRLWIRRGYDPRLDPSSKKYQILIINITQKILSYDNSLATGDGVEVTEPVYDENYLPTKQYIYPQLMHIAIDEIQQLVHANDGLETLCTYTDGWCSPGVLDRCRTIFTDIILRNYNSKMSQLTLKHATEE